MDLHGTHLRLLTVGIEAAEELLPAFNGDEQFMHWSGFPAGLSLSQVQEDMQETAKIPGGTTWRMADREGSLIGVAETAFYPSQDTGWIALLIIRREFQGRGYGREAATLLEDHLYSFSEVREIGIAVLVQNTPAQAFWEKRGYQRIAERNDNHGNALYEYRLHEISRTRRDL